LAFHSGGEAVCTSTPQCTFMGWCLVEGSTGTLPLPLP
jgi:hypothetical protein